MIRLGNMLQRLKQIKLLNTIYRAKWIRFVVPLAVIAFVYWEGQKEFRRIDWGAALHYLHQMQPTTLLYLFGFSLVAVATLSIYDFVIRRYFRFPVGKWDTFRYSWIANTSNSVIGLAGIVGAGLRTVLYRKHGIPMSKIAAAIAFISTISLTGLSLLAWAGIIGVLPIHIFEKGHRWTLYAVWIFALFLPFFVLLQRSRLFAKWFNRNQEPMDWNTIALSVAASLLEWLCAGINFWLIGSCLLPHLSLSNALGIYSVAAIAGLISMAPGGIGGFDLTALLGLRLLGYHPNQTAATLVLFRMMYYILPWLIGLVMAAFEFVNGDKKKGHDNESGLEHVLNTWQKIWHWPGEFGIVSEIGAWALGKLILASGLVLLLSAATPALVDRLRFTSELLSAPLMRLSHLLSVIIGLILIVLSWGISHRVKRAYQWTIYLLCAGALFTFAKAFDYEEAIFLLIVAVILWVSRNRFYRAAAPFDMERAALWGLITLMIGFLYVQVGSHIHPGFLKQLPADINVNWLVNPRQHTVTGVIAVAVAWLIISMFLLLRPNRAVGKGASDHELNKLKAFLEHHEGNLLTHTLFTGDKSFFWGMNERVLIPYAKIRNKLVVLGDPIGEKELISAAIQEFQQFADKYALSIAFYQVTPPFLPIYHDNGYRFFKLGEEALVPLERFTLSGKENASLRNVKNRFVRGGYRFEIVQPPFDKQLMESLQLISKLWLRGRREKGFSLGWFDTTYLQLAPIALLYNVENKIIAFASLAPGYDNRAALSVDLMRHLPDTPNGAMDYLFICLLEWSKAEGYRYFNLGMAPLAQVGVNKKAIREEKLAQLLFQYGGYWYGFEGLRKYKEKFSPSWEPRYLAYHASEPLPILLPELVWLIARSPRILKQ